MKRTKKRNILCIILICFWGVYCGFGMAMMVGKNKDTKLYRIRKDFDVTKKWIEYIEDKHNVSDYFNKNKYKKIAIYGYGQIGKILIEQLEKMDLNVQYVVDKNAFYVKTRETKVLRPWDDLPEVDVVVVTPVWDYENIKSNLETKINCPIISIEDIFEVR